MDQGQTMGWVFGCLETMWRGQGWMREETLYKDRDGRGYRMVCHAENRTQKFDISRTLW